MELEDLKRESVAKWQNIVDNFDELGEDGDLHNRAFHFCSFCRDVMNSSDIGIGYIDINGEKCGEFCKIDKEICGSEDCLLAKLYNLSEESDFFSDDGKELCVEVLEKLKSMD